MTTPVYYAGSIADTQDLYTITYPLADIEQTLISNVSKATTAVVTTQSSLPKTFADGDLVLVAGVGGMTELATAGVDDGRTFYANVTSANTFQLFTDSALTANVDSSSFSNATANTGGVSFFTVPQYNTVPSPQNVVFNNSITSSGTLISLDSDTGVISLDDVNDFSLTAIVNTTRPLPPVSTAGYQWFNMTSDEYIGSFTKFGQPCTAIISVSATTQVVLRVFSDTGTFEYPNQLFDSSFEVQLSVPV